MDMMELKNETLGPNETSHKSAGRVLPIDMIVYYLHKRSLHDVFRRRILPQRTERVR